MPFFFQGRNYVEVFFSVSLAGLIFSDYTYFFSVHFFILL